MKKRFLSVLLILLLAASTLLGCGAKEPAVSTTADLASVTETAKATAETKQSVETTAPASGEKTTDAATTAAVPETEPATEAATTAAPETQAATSAAAPPETKAAIDENGKYYSKDEVALYIHTYGHLPSNFITKKEAKAAGWTGGSLEPWFPGCVIGGDYFGNYEGLLPKKKGRTYYECDIDTKGRRSRGARRIIFSNDGYIYYTDDHYESFTELYKGGAS